MIFHFFCVRIEFDLNESFDIRIVVVKMSQARALVYKFTLQIVLLPVRP